MDRSNWVCASGRVARSPSLSEFQVYACGAPIVVDSARADYVGQAGLPDEAFFADSFTTEADKAKESN